MKIEMIDKNHIVIKVSNIIERKYLESKLDWKQEKGKLEEIMCELKGYKCR